MKTIKPLLIEVRPSKYILGEVGLFAARSLKKDTVIAEASKFGERFVPWSEFKKIDKITRRKIQQFCLVTKDGFYMPEDLNYITVPWNMNHHCDYNVGLDDVGNYVTAKNIKANEELLLDYGLMMSDPKFKFDCHCGAKNCRKVITGNDWKNPDYMEKNKKYFLRELIELAEKQDKGK